MCEDRCLSHGCVMEYDYRSGFTLCPQCEEESVPVNELLALQAQAKRLTNGSRLHWSKKEKLNEI